MMVSVLCFSFISFYLHEVYFSYGALASTGQAVGSGGAREQAGGIVAAIIAGAIALAGLYYGACGLLARRPGSGSQALAAAVAVCIACGALFNSIISW